MNSNMPSMDELAELALSYYLDSNDHNGLRVESICKRDSGDLRAWLDQVAEHPHLEILTITLETNPHIIRTGFASPSDTAAALNQPDLSLYHTTIYPSKLLLSERIDADRNQSRPFCRELDLGEHQLAFRFFKIATLEKYFRDPRFDWRFDGIYGRIYPQTDEDGNPLVNESEFAFVKQFGAAYLADRERPLPCITVTLRDLKELNPFDQAHWKQHEIAEKAIPHPDFYGSVVTGNWGNYISIYNAVFEEISLINDICSQIGWKPMFAEDFLEDPPREFFLMPRPTKRNLDRFFEIADKVLSDNLNRSFFIAGRHSVSAIGEDGSPLGTRALLIRWIKKNFRFSDDSHIKEIDSSLKKVRSIRSKSSHSIGLDAYSEDIYLQQRSAVKEIYNAVRNIRMTLQCHPIGRTIDAPPLLLTGERIWQA